ncbi:MAG: C4-type zinc ribbon domain-containing protein [Oryzomonas sp.]
MKKRLEMLEQLQEIDYLIDNLKTARNGLAGEMGGIEQALIDARLELAGLESRVVQLEQEKGELEASQAAEQENIRRSETNMKEIKTNKEYQAVGREIAAARKQAAEIEEQTLQKMGLIDGLNTEIASLKDTLADLELNTSRRRDEKQAEIDNIQQDIDADVARREAITKELPASLVKRYNALRGQRRGQAVAIARDGYCLGCNMNLPPQLYNSLFRGDELISCPHCQRVLILKQQQSQ